jgi:hypothetical protein
LNDALYLQEGVTLCTHRLKYKKPQFYQLLTTGSLTLREVLRLTVFENRVLRGIFGPKWDEVTGERRKLHNGEIHILYSSPDIIK